MNFFGHAIAAARVNREPAFILGAMLPDLGKMAGCRRVQPPHPLVAAGIAHHHQVDARFHELDGFTAACSEGRAVLEAQGLPRGAAMAVAHVGIELLLDGSWPDQLTKDLPLHEALTIDSSTTGFDPSSHARFDELRRALRGRDFLAGYREPAEVARRLERILAGRPRLSFPAAHRTTVERWLAQVRPSVVRHSLMWLDAVH